MKILLAMPFALAGFVVFQKPAVKGTVPIESLELTGEWSIENDQGIQVANTFMTSDGRVGHTVGNAVHFSDGSVGHTVGNMIHTSDGSVGHTFGNVVHTSNGSVFHTFGNTLQLVPKVNVSFERQRLPEPQISTSIES